MIETKLKLEDNLNPLLAEKKFEEIYKQLTNPDNDKYVLENVWNLIYSICITLKSDSLLENAADVKLCQKILMYLIDKGNPKEILMSLLEQADSFKDHNFFCLLLDPLKHTLQKNPGKRGKSLQWVLSTLNAHIETLELPEDLDLQGEEKLLLDADPAVQDAVYILSNYYSFVECFVNEVSFDTLRKTEIHYIDRIHNQREIMLRYILKLFYRPLLYQDLHVDSNIKPKSSIRVLCESFVTLLSKICSNVFHLYKYDESPKIKKEDMEDLLCDEDNSVNSLAFANLSYLIFVENLALNFQPFIYSNLYIFMKNLKYIILLLEKKENLILFKGLNLAENLLNQLNTSELNYDCIELEVFTKFPKLLLDIAVFGKIDEHRKLSLSVFTSYVSKCNTVGRYHLIMQVLYTIKHSGAQGLVINFYKNYLHEALNCGSSEHYFLGKNLNMFLKRIFVLNEGVETDILENSDKIMSSLNLLRYLLLRDKENNVTGICDMINFVDKKFCTPLTTALDMSRAHYKQALIDAEEQSKKSNKDEDCVNTIVSVNKEILPNVPFNHKKDVFQKALVTFDVIESILSRVKELI